MEAQAAPTEFLILKVHIDLNDMTTTMKFPSNHTIEQVLAHIIEKFGGVNKPENFGIYLPSESDLSDKLLPKSSILNSYNLNRGDLIKFKKMIRPVQIETYTGMKKIVSIRDDQNVKSIIESFCGSVGISCNESFQLTLDENGHSKILRKDLTLLDQEVHATVTLQLRLMLVETDPNLVKLDPATIDAKFDESLQDYLSGGFQVSWDKCCELAALLMQVKFGDFDSVRWPTISPADILPPQHRIENWEREKERDVIRQYQKLVGMRTQTAKIRFSAAK